MATVPVEFDEIKLIQAGVDVTAVSSINIKLAASGPGDSGWTTSDKNHGQGIKEEDKNDPYSDDSFGAKGNFELDWE